MSASGAGARIVLSTAPDFAKAREISRALVERRVAACVNVLPGATSIYRWKGAIEEASEVLLVIKSTEARVPDLERALLEVHPYETPEFVVLDPTHVEAEYARWLLDETAPGR